MKLLFENWRKHLNEKTFADYEADKGEWVDKFRVSKQKRV